MTTLRRELISRIKDILGDYLGEDGIHSASERLADAVLDLRAFTLKAVENIEVPEKPSLTEEEIADAVRKVDVILQLNSKRGDAWDGRDQFRDNHLHYADWWHKLTNLKCGKRAAKSWKKAFSEWQSEGLEIRHLQESYNTDLPWKKIIADPNEITKKAIAIKAMSEKGNDGKGPDVDASGAPITY